MDKSKRVLIEIKKMSRELSKGSPGLSVYLYGSRARGDNTEDSDWDLLIVNEDSVSSFDDFEKLAFPFAEIGWKYGEQITPLLYTKSEWESERFTAFYHNVISEGILL